MGVILPVVIVCLAAGHAVLAEGDQATQGETMASPEWKYNSRTFVEHLSKVEEDCSEQWLLGYAGPADEVESVDASVKDRIWKYESRSRETTAQGPAYFAFRVTNGLVAPLGGGGGGCREGNRVAFTKLLSQVRKGWTTKELLDHVGLPTLISPGAEKSIAEWRYTWTHKADRGAENDTFTITLRKSVVTNVASEYACKLSPRGR